MNSKPKTTWIVTTVIALFAIVAGTYYSIRPKQQAENSNAAADVSLTFNTPTISSNINTTLTPKIMINPTTNQVTAVEVNLSFDPNKVTINSITNTGVFTKTLTAPVINNTNGTAKFIFGVNATATQPPVPITAVSEVASLSITTKTTIGNASITIANTSIATAIGLDTSVLGTYGTMVINVQTTATAIPTMSPSPIPTATPVPTTGSTTVPTFSPSPIPTATTFYPAWDVNRDTFTNIIDIGLIVDNYGSSAPSNPRADVNGDGTINIIDIGIVVDHYQ